VFQGVTLHGGPASLLWGYRTAAVLTSWRITRVKRGRWALAATVSRVDPFQLRQRPLLFTAPRARGFWAWGVISLDEVTPRTISATLGPPEQ
jgi:hypothetical protein